MREGDVTRALLLDVDIFDKKRNFGCRSVDGAEGEDIKEEKGVIIQEVFDCFFDEFVVCICGERNLAHAVYAVDVRKYEKHSEIPIIVFEGGETHGAEGDVVREDMGRGRICGEKLDVEGVGGVDGDHGFAVVV